MFFGEDWGEVGWDVRDFLLFFLCIVVRVDVGDNGGLCVDGLLGIFGFLGCEFDNLFVLIFFCRFLSSEESCGLY